MCWLSRKVRGQFPEFIISGADFANLITAEGMTIPCHLFDSQYYYVSHEDWGKIFADVLLNMPGYTTDKFDCEDFALLVKARVAEKYRLNSIAVLIGDTPRGRHGFNMFLSDIGLFLLEPQTGDVFNLGEQGYVPEFVII